MTCALCGKETSSLYSLRGEFAVRMCSTCFFKPLPTVPASEGKQA